MEFFDVIEKRYSVRAYQSEPVEDEKLEKILEAGSLAPTAHNNQPFQIFVIHTQDRREELLCLEFAADHRVTGAHCRDRLSPSKPQHGTRQHAAPNLEHTVAPSFRGRSPCSVVRVPCAGGFQRPANCDVTRAQFRRTVIYGRTDR